MKDLKHEFWDRIEDVRACMLGLADKGPLVAMSPQVDDDLPDISGSLPQKAQI